MLMIDGHTSLWVALGKNDCEGTICQGWSLSGLSKRWSPMLDIWKERKVN